MNRLFFLLLLLIETGIGHAQYRSERLYIQTDKDFYLSGEKVWMKIYGLSEDFKPMPLSRVAYVELLGNAGHAVRLKVAMDQGVGCAMVELPYTLPSGVYELTGYTRWMRNEGESVFFRKPVAVFNSLRYIPVTDKVEFMESQPVDTEKRDDGNIVVKTDKDIYGTREKIIISLDHVPEKAHLAVSITRKDVDLSSLDMAAYKEKQSVPAQKVEEPIYMPELEGLIIEGKYIPDNEDGDVAIVRPNLSLQGNPLRYYAGQVKQDHQVLFYTPLLQGMTEVVTGVDKAGHIELLSPFIATCPREMKTFYLYADQEEQLMERCMQVQVNRYFATDTLSVKRVSQESLTAPEWSYDLDQYRRFGSFEETFLEFMPGVSTIRLNGQRHITVFDGTTTKFNQGNTLVMLDGVAIMNHEDILKYNPYLVKRIDVYTGNYVFADQLYNGILYLRTLNGKMSGFQLGNNSVLCEYDGPQPTMSFSFPSFSDQGQQNIPDFRHTLYWNPSVTGQTKRLECTTSDLRGMFVIKVEGLTEDGEIVNGKHTFIVK